MKLALEVQDVSKVYGDGTKALDRVSLDVKEGEILALLGAVSYTHLRAHETLMNIVCRLLLEKKIISLCFRFYCLLQQLRLHLRENFLLAEIL